MDANLKNHSTENSFKTKTKITAKNDKIEIETQKY